METILRKPVVITDLIPFYQFSLYNTKANMLISLIICVCACAFSSIRTSNISGWKDMINDPPQIMFCLENNEK